MRVLVTGGAGFVGSHLAERLVSAGHEVFVADDLSRGRRDWLPPKAVLLEVDLRDRDAVSAAVETARPEAVAHLAALHFIPAVDDAPRVAWALNVGGTESLLAALRSAPPSRFVLASTAAVYPDLAGPIHESVQPDPIDLYGRTKAEAERLVRAFGEETGTRCVLARIFNVVGPRETNPHVVPEIVTQLLDGATELELGNLDAARDFVDVRDVAEALDRLLWWAPPGTSALNVGSGRAVSVAGIVAVCERVLDRPIPVVTSPDRVRAVERKELVADVTELEAALGWRPRRTLGATLSELLGGAAPRCVCGSSDYAVVLRASYDRLYLRGYHFRVAECRACGLARTLPVPDASQYRDGYAITTRNGEFAGQDDRWSEELARWIAARATGSRLLDVGCASGNLVAAASAFGFAAEGVDVDPVATDWGRKRGRPVRAVAIEEVEGAYDTIVLSHVLEHLAEPGAMLRETARLLAPGGRLFVFVPNKAGLLPRLMRARWMGWVPSEHVWHFTPRTLRRTVEQSAPLRLVECTTRGVMEPPSSGAKGRAKAATATLSRAVGWGDQIEAIFERRNGHG